MNFGSCASRAGDIACFWSTYPISIQHATEEHIESGTVWVNTHGALGPAIPFGGYTQSGIGRELDEASIRNYTSTKSIVAVLSL